MTAILDVVPTHYASKSGAKRRLTQLGLKGQLPGIRCVVDGQIVRFYAMTDTECASAMTTTTTPKKKRRARRTATPTTKRRHS
jgi:hypothetical protein